MLKNINRLLTPMLLKVLAEMGHGDEIVLADANFTASSLAADRHLIVLPGIAVADACAAVMSVLPLDEAVAQPVGYMFVSGKPMGYMSAVQRRVLASMVELRQAHAAQWEALDRFAFYARAKQAFAIVQTGEMQPYANFILKKGVIAHELAD
jgi:L-fucose mutarotase